MSKSFSWDASIACEGGPILVTDLDTFERWIGSAPIVQVRAMLPADHPILPRLPEQKALRLWGRFTDELPEPFRFIGGGHRTVTCASEAEARSKLIELREAVRVSFDGELVDEVESSGSFRFSRRDGAPLFAQLAPNSVYDAAWQSHASDTEGYVFPIADVPALFWQMEGAGTAEVGIADDRSEIVLVRSWLSGDAESEAQEKERVRALAAASADDEEHIGELVIDSGVATLVWAPIGHHQVDEIFAEPNVATRVADEAIVPLHANGMDVGVALRVPPGRWLATAGRHDEGSWACHWCRLRSA